jgi:putative transposase
MVHSQDMRQPHIQLTQEERDALEALVKKGKSSAPVYRRAIGLLELDRGKTLTAVAETTSVSIQTMSTLRDNYKQRGLACLEDAPRPGRPLQITGEQRAKITALACSKPPTGHSQWSLRLLADKVVELGYCERISHTEVGKILKKTNSNRT